MGRRFLRRQRSYPGLVEIFEAFYQSIRTHSPSPVSPESILETVTICEHIAAELTAAFPAPVMAPTAADRAPIVVTGGTGFLGKAVAQLLARRGSPVRVVARRMPGIWDRLPGVQYVVADLAKPLPAEVLAGSKSVIHCAAETAGGWDQHQTNSLDSTTQLVQAAADAGVRRIVHVSSLSVMAPPARGRPVDEGSPLEPDSRACGPYAWGKTESELLASELCAKAGIELRIVRPGAFVDYNEFDPPGLLGKRLGNLLVAIGSPAEPLAVADITFSAQTLVWMLDNFENAPSVLHLLDPERPVKADLVRRLRKSNPDLRVLWLPRFVLVPLSWMAILLQKILRPRHPAIDVAKTFARQRFDASRIAALAPEITSGASTLPLPARPGLPASAA
jgi:nucleoside-diphosphate-sugar epimerase